MKRTLSILLTGLMAFTLVACGTRGNSSSSNTTNQEQEKITEESGANGKSLVVGVGTDITQVDPHLSNKMFDVAVYGNIFDTLVIMDEDNQLHANPAESWERPNDTEVIFHLRKDVKFSNGDPMTADDVAFSIQRVLDSPYVNYVLAFVDKVEIIDDYTVAVYSSEPFGPFLAHFTVPYVGIVNKKVCEEQGENFSKDPIGTGAYELVEWKPGESVTLKANEYYWQDAPQISNVKFVVQPDSSARLMALESGEIDIAYEVVPNDISKIEANDKLEAVVAPSLACYMLPCNLEKQGNPLTDPNVRQAVNYGIDRQAIVEAVASGYANAAGDMIPQGIIGYSERCFTPVERDLEKAKEYLEKSNYSDDCTFTIFTNDNSERVEIANIIQYQLSEVGINVNIEVMEASTLTSRVHNSEHDTLIDRWLTDTADAYYTLTGLYASWSSVGEGNVAFYNSEDADEAILTAGKEFDDNERVKLYEHVYDILNEDLPYIPIYNYYDCVGIKSNIEGFKIAPAGNHQLRFVTIS